MLDDRVWNEAIPGRFGVSRQDLHALPGGLGVHGRSGVDDDAPVGQRADQA
jgi:hypothetical protein